MRRDSMSPKEFGNYIKNKRLDRGFTLQELGERIGKSKSYLSHIENGRRGIPDPELLKEISEALNVNHMELMTMAGHIPDLTKKEKEILRANEEFKKSLNVKLEEALEKITKDNKFIDGVLVDIQSIEGYFDLNLEEEQQITPDFLRELVSNVDWRQEWISDLVSSVFFIANEWEKKENKDITDFLSLPNITYKNKPLSEDDRKRILSMLDLMFPES